MLSLYFDLVGLELLDLELFGLLLNCFTLFFLAVLRFAILSFGGRLRVVVSDAGLSVTGKPSNDCSGSALLVKARMAVR